MIKYLFPIVLFMVGISACTSDSETEADGQEDELKDNFTISGTIDGAGGEIFYLEAQSPNGTISITSGPVDANGNFNLTGNIPGLGLYQLRLGESLNNALLLTLSPGDDLKIKANTENYASTPSASGTSWAPYLSEYMVQVSDFRKEQEQLNAEKGKYTEEQLMAKYLALKADIDSFAIQSMRKDPGNPFNIVLSTYAVPSMNFNNWDPSSLEVLRAVSEAFVKKYENSPMSQTLANQVYQIEMAYNQYLANKSGTRPAPEIALKNPDGKEIKLSSLRGKYVLIDFWASWCAPCRRESPNVVRLYHQYKNKGFTVYSVSLDNDKEAWKAAIEKDGLAWPNHVSDLLQWNSPMPQLYGFDGIPYTVLVNKEGNIIGTGLRGAELEQKLKEIFEN